MGYPLDISNRYYRIAGQQAEPQPQSNKTHRQELGVLNTDLLPTRLWEYLIATILIVLAPGPSVLFIIARAIAWGRASAIATVAGNTVGVLMISLLVAVGLGPLLQRSTLFYNGIQWAGGLYLIYLGFQAIKASKLVASELQKGDGAKPTLLASAKNGFWVGALNPKTIVFFAAILHFIEM
ncbi:hypothetical protein FGO68_gene11026 [Halteria grandinella]|uniref:LysE family translocator n=1 Tax=Halteria grandinella TaxID=5974 RepID=A0A8J8N9D1_HALGN|nr:hypothetical protein FGO68_gene11026 [Halteria grandinella]